jgi:hypothetical protein
MDNKSNQAENTRGGSTSDTQRKFNIAGGQDLPDNLKDEEKMKPENMTIDLPDVEDIPGQENVKPMPIGELADTTISSDDEEGVGLFGDDDEDDELVIANDSNVSMQEKKDLQLAEEDMPTDDDTNLRKASLDNEDEDGEPLNEEGFGEDVTGDDLDIPGSEADDANEEIGEEDEENNAYSASDENNDNVS